MTADLHVHTTSSDGTLTPADIVAACVSAGVGTVAITDHDAVDGIAAAVEAAKGKPVRVVPGVEMTAYAGDKEVHVVGLFLDPGEAGLREVLRKTRDERTNRVYRMVEQLQKLGIKIEAEDVFKVAGEGAPGRVHVAQALLKVGQVGTIGDAFRMYIGSGGPAYVQKYQLSPAEAVRAIHEAGGAAIVAHPGAGLADGLVMELIEHGADGLEAYHPLHSRQQSEHYLRLAERLGVLVSGGSDCHGAVAEGAPIGAVVVEDERVERIERRAKGIRNSPRMNTDERG